MHTQANPDLERAKMLTRAAVGAQLRQKVQAVREERPELTFVQAWAPARKEEPDVFAYAERIESGNWPGETSSRAKKLEPVRITAKKDEPELLVVQGGFATRLSA